MADYKYGEPDKYGDFPYLYAGKWNPDNLNEILLERLPASYDMQLVEQNEVDVLAAAVNQGIDAHLEACTTTKEAAIEDRTLPDGRVIQRHLGVGFDPKGMICLIRRLMEFNPNDYWDFTGCDPSEECPEQSQEERDMWDASYQLVSSILETLQIEYMG